MQPQHHIVRTDRSSSLIPLASSFSTVGVRDQSQQAAQQPLMYQAQQQAPPPQQQPLYAAAAAPPPQQQPAYSQAILFPRKPVKTDW